VTAYIVRRLALGVIVLFLATLIIFAMMHVLPGDPVDIITGGQSQSYGPKELAALKHEYHLDKPIITQYFYWIGGVLHGDFGKSLVNGESVAAMIGRRLPVTLNLTIVAAFISAILGVTAGIISAIRRGKWLDTLFTTGANLGITAPNFLIAIVLIYVFSYKIKLLPTYGYTSPFTDFSLHLQKMIIPVIALCLFGLASIARQTRSSMLEVVHQDYVRTAWAKGLSERVIVIRHMLKNSLIPVITTMGMQISFMIGGAVLVETVCNIPGMGRMAADGVKGLDYPVVMGVVVVTAVVIVLVNIAVDITYAFLDPRIRVR
jgi:peptide/nickel transport system permease protein